MRLLGTNRSPYVRKVRVFAAEAGLSDQIELDIRKVHMANFTPDVSAINPLGRVPTLFTDDGRVLMDSLTIGVFLAGQAGRKDMWPSQQEALLRVMNTHALGTGLIDIMILLLVEKGKPQERIWPEVMTAATAKITAVLDYLDADVAALESEGCTLGTLSVAVALDYLDFRFKDIDWRISRSKLGRWHEKFIARPALRDHPFVDDTPALAGKIR